MDKVEAARRQLGTALALYLSDHDSVSVQCLACAGMELSEHLSEKAGAKTYQSFLVNPENELTQKTYRELRNRYANALKHATSHRGVERDDSQILQEFSDKENDSRLFIGWFDYASSGMPHPIESHVFQTWFLALDLSKIEHPAFCSELERAFPKLSTRSRRDQKKILYKEIAKAKLDRNMMRDPKVEQRPLMLGLVV